MFTKALLTRFFLTIPSDLDLPIIPFVYAHLHGWRKLNYFFTNEVAKSKYLIKRGRFRWYFQVMIIGIDWLANDVHVDPTLVLSVQIDALNSESSKRSQAVNI